MKVMVAATVLGISKALATPNFATFIERDRARLSAEQLLSNLYITQILKPSSASEYFIKIRSKAERSSGSQEL